MVESAISTEGRPIGLVGAGGGGGGGRLLAGLVTGGATAATSVLAANDPRATQPERRILTQVPRDPDLLNRVPSVIRAMTFPPGVALTAAPPPATSERSNPSRWVAAVEATLIQPSMVISA